MTEISHPVSIFSVSSVFAGTVGFRPAAAPGPLTYFWFADHGVPASSAPPANAIAALSLGTGRGGDAGQQEPTKAEGRPHLPAGQKDIGGAERPVVVPIDGAPRTFTLTEAGQAQVAELNLPDHRIMLQAHRWPIEDIKLVTATDLTPYLEGRRRLMTQLRAHLGMDERDQRSRSRAR